MVKGAGRGRPAKRAGTSGSGNYTRKVHGPVQRARDKTRRQGPRLLDDPANDERLLGVQLRRLGLYAADTLGDGSCLFRSLSDQLHGTPNYHYTIRQDVCAFLLGHQSEFIAFIDDSSHSSPEAAFAAHVAEMRQPGTYGTQVEIVAFARMVKRSVKVIQAELVYVINYEDESPSEKEKRALRNDRKGKGKEEEDNFPILYIVYHNWEHYSSARNIAGPHTGLPCIVEEKAPSAGADPEAKVEDEALATQEESLILSSLRFPHRHTVTEIRKLIHDHGGQWEQALEFLLENEIDETESEDFNNPSPQPPPDKALPPPTPMDLGISAHGAAPSLPAHLLHGSRYPGGVLSADHRSSSPSASSSTATSTTNHSASTTATQLSDIGHEPDLAGRLKPASSATSASPSCSSSATRVRSRAPSTDLDILAIESPRQRFRIAREPDEKEDASSSVAGNDDLAGFEESSSVVSVSSTGSINGAESDSASPTDTTRVPQLSQPDRPASAPIPARKPGRPPKKKDSLAVPHLPTRRQRKQLSKSGAASPVGARTRSKIPPVKEENGLQREFRELYV